MWKKVYQITYFWMSFVVRNDFNKTNNLLHFPLTTHLHSQIIKVVNLTFCTLDVELRCFKTLPLPPPLTKTQRCVHRLVTRWIWELSADWSPAPHCHSVNLHHMVRPLGLLTDELGEQVYRLLFQSRGGQSSFKRSETRSTCRHVCLFGHNFFPHLLMRLVSISTS